MNAIRNTNTFAIGIPILLGVIGLAFNEFLLLAALSTMLTGFLQVLLGVAFWIKFPENKHIRIYFGGVVFFFMLWYLFPSCCYIWAFPVALCLYLSVLIYTPNETK